MQDCSAHIGLTNDVRRSINNAISDHDAVVHNRIMNRSGVADDDVARSGGLLAGHMEECARRLRTMTKQGAATANMSRGKTADQQAAEDFMSGESAPTGDEQARAMAFMAGEGGGR